MLNMRKSIARRKTSSANCVGDASVDGDPYTLNGCWPEFGQHSETYLSIFLSKPYDLTHSMMRVMLKHRAQNV